MDTDRYVLIGRGLAGWHAAMAPVARNGSTTSGWSSGGTLEGYAANADDGTPVYDAAGADETAFTALVCGGPVVSATMPGRTAGDGYDGLRVTLPEGPITVAAYRALGLHGLHYVGIDGYVDMLRAIPGMQIGRVVGGRVAWEAPIAGCDHSDTHMIDGGVACAACGRTWTGGCAPSGGV